MIGIKKRTKTYAAFILRLFAGGCPSLLTKRICLGAGRAGDAPLAELMPTAAAHERALRASAPCWLWVAKAMPAFTWDAQEEMRMRAAAAGTWWMWDVVVALRETGQSGERLKLLGG
jgi:hypothetical protein